MMHRQWLRSVLLGWNILSLGDRRKEKMRKPPKDIEIPWKFTLPRQLTAYPI
jgi:hypothetical protein